MTLKHQPTSTDEFVEMRASCHHRDRTIDSQHQDTLRERIHRLLKRSIDIITMPRFCAITGEFDLGDESDLRQNYQNAVDCLIECETLFNSFQEQLRLKEDRIVTLEDKVMELSLELAAVKARQDLPNLKRNEFGGGARPRPARGTQVLKRSSTSGSSSNGNDRRTSWTSWASDNTNNINKLPNFGNLINKSLHWLEAKQTTNDGAVQVEFPKDENVYPTIDAGGGGGPATTSCKMLRQHTSNIKKRSSGSLHLERPLRRSRSSAFSGFALSALTLEGVIFPVSSFEVYNKGCRVDRVNKKPTDMRNSEWPELG
jgi:hypothetical protein